MPKNISEFLANGKHTHIHTDHPICAYTIVYSLGGKGSLPFKAVKHFCFFFSVIIKDGQFFFGFHRKVYINTRVCVCVCGQCMKTYLFIYVKIPEKIATRRTRIAQIEYKLRPRDLDEYKENWETSKSKRSNQI